MLGKGQEEMSTVNVPKIFVFYNEVPIVECLNRQNHWIKRELLARFAERTVQGAQRQMRL